MNTVFRFGLDWCISKMQCRGECYRKCEVQTCKSLTPNTEDRMDQHQGYSRLLVVLQYFGRLYLVLTYIIYCIGNYIITIYYCVCVFESVSMCVCVCVFES